MNTIISASILSCDLSDIMTTIRKLEKAGINMLHFDVMDGIFVKPISFGSVVAESIRKHSNIFIDTHLMVKSPGTQIEQFAEAKVNMITFHVESECNIAEELKKIREYGIKTGLSLKPSTAVEVVYPYLGLLDNVLIMTVEPGYGGQSFIPSMLNKIEKLKRQIVNEGLKTDIQVDGGINLETAQLAKQAGANNLVVGSFLINSSDIKSEVNALIKA